MPRCLYTVVVITVLAGRVPSSKAQPPPGALGSGPALDEARWLTATVKRLYAEGKVHDAISPAQRSLALREKVLGPMHPDVATSLNNLADSTQNKGRTRRQNRSMSARSA